MLIPLAFWAVMTLCGLGVLFFSQQAIFAADARAYATKHKALKTISAATKMLEAVIIEKNAKPISVGDRLEEIKGVEGDTFFMVPFSLMEPLYAAVREYHTGEVVAPSKSAEQQP